MRAGIRRNFAGPSTCVVLRFANDNSAQDDRVEIVLGFTVLSDVPKNARRIAQVKNPKSPGLHFRGLAHYAGILAGELLFLDVLPPSIRIVHVH